MPFYWVKLTIKTSPAGYPIELSKPVGGGTPVQQTSLLICLYFMKWSQELQITGRIDAHQSSHSNKFICRLLCRKVSKLRNRKKALIAILGWMIFLTYLSFASLLDSFKVSLPLGTLDFDYIIAGLMIGFTALAILLLQSKRTNAPLENESLPTTKYKEATEERAKVTLLQPRQR